MFVAHAFSDDGSLTYTRGGFTSPAAAESQARLARAHGASPGAWAVVQASMRQYALWAIGDHSQPVSGILRAAGGSQGALTAAFGPAAVAAVA